MGSLKEKKIATSHYQGTQLPSNIVRFFTNKYLTLSLKNSKSISLDFAEIFLKTLGDPKEKKIVLSHFQGTQLLSNIARFCTNRYLTLSLKNQRVYP